MCCRRSNKQSAARVPADGRNEDAIQQVDGVWSGEPSDRAGRQPNNCTAYLRPRAALLRIAFNGSPSFTVDR